MKNQIADLLQRYEDSLGPSQHGELRVPYGVIRPVKNLLPEYDFVSNPTIRRNITYAVEALDFFRWLINRFKTYGPVRGYQYKVGLVLVDMILEGLTRDFIKQKRITPAKRHSQNINKLRNTSVPSEHVDWIKAVHNRRSNIHLYLISDLEATKYKISDWNNSIRCLRRTKQIFRKELGNI